jgi:hypothetical protein
MSTPGGRAGTFGIIIFILMAVTLPPAHATDRPISAVKLILKRVGTKQKLVLVSRDGAFLFPLVGGTDDPAAGTPGGLLIELFSPAEPAGASLAAPPGSGNPGWKARDGSHPRYKFRNNPGTGCLLSGAQNRPEGRPNLACPRQGDGARAHGAAGRRGDPPHHWLAAQLCPLRSVDDRAR